MNTETLTFETLLNEKKSLFLNELRERLRAVDANEVESLSAAKDRERAIRAQATEYLEKAQELEQQKRAIEAQMPVALCDDPAGAAQMEERMLELDRDIATQKILADKILAAHVPGVQSETKARQQALQSAVDSVITGLREDIADELGEQLLEVAALYFAWNESLQTIGAEYGVSVSPCVTHRLRCVDSLKQLSRPRWSEFRHNVITNIEKDLRSIKYS